MKQGQRQGKLESIGSLSKPSNFRKQLTAYGKTTKEASFLQEYSPGIRWRKCTGKPYLHLLYSRLVRPKLNLARLISMLRTAMPCMEPVVKPKTCSTLARIFDLFRPRSFCSSISGWSRYPFFKNPVLNSFPCEIFCERFSGAGVVGIYDIVRLPVRPWPDRRERMRL